LYKLGNLKVQEIQLCKVLIDDETFKASEGWLWRMKVLYGIWQFDSGVETPFCASAATKVFAEILCKAATQRQQV
jgi:hypothetical protein